VVLENVCGTLRSHGGKDFAAIADAVASAGYRFGALVIDAVKFLPQSRPRLFVVGTFDRTTLPQRLIGAVPDLKWNTQALIEAQTKLPKEAAKRWVWWTLPEPRTTRSRLSDLVEENPMGVDWHSERETQRLLSLIELAPSWWTPGLGSQ